MKIPTLKKNKEFYRVYNRGKAYVSPVVVTYVFKRRYGVAKIGITAGKKIGKAVKRNRARRVIMAALRELYPRIDNRYDIVFPDFYLTPTDRYAKRPDNFPAKDRIEYISRDNSNSFLIDDSIQSNRVIND